MDWQKLLGRVKNELTIRSQARELVLSTTPRSVVQREAILQKKILQYVGMGYEVQMQSDFQAVLSYNKRPNHILHFFLTILLIGFWLIVWIIIALKNHKYYLTITVDEFGNTRFQDH
jgi:hypothetical protein